ncbi:hypothetical protein JCM10213v2_004932 [Rhodosporidiobolus nylandii]
MLEKGRLPPPVASEKPSPGRTRRIAFVVAVLLLALFRFGGPFWPLSWTNATLPPAVGIYWQPCPDHASSYCSFLNVPLDYLNPKANETVSLALRMLPATVPPEEQLGYLLVNPGGPGGSGTGALVDLSPFLPVVYEGRYNLVSWDPRGVNLTGPALGCFETEGDANRFTHDLEHLGLSYANASELMWLSKVDGFARALNSACQTSGNQDVLRTSTTAFTARDMKSIVEALGEEKLNYWGFSYGTILGSTFAAMFPDLVGRFILDGVSDAETYANNMWDWGRSGMSDTHKTFDGFFHHCALSGPEGCELARENTTAQEIKERYDALLDKLRAAPLPVGRSAVGPGTLTASDVQYTMFHALYQPRFWPRLAHLLARTVQGDASELYAVANVGSAKLGRKNPVGRHNPFHRAMQPFLASSAAIMCSDTDHGALGDSSTLGMAEWMRELRASTKSPTADIWAVWLSACRHWSAEPVERYSGPWTREKGLNKTSNPILFFSQTADPVTPLRSAEKMTAGFGEDSARLLVQNGFGHCSFAHPSLCTAKAMRAYLLDGELPANGTRCDGDASFLFPHAGETSQSLAALSVEDRRLIEALHGLSSVVGRMRMGPQ